MSQMYPGTASRSFGLSIGLPNRANAKNTQRVSVVLSCLLLSFSISASAARADGPEFSWVPVDASAPFTTAQPDGAGVDTEMIIPAAYEARIVEFEVRVNGWATAPGAPDVGTAVASVNASGFLGINAAPSNPGVNLTPLNNQGWRENPGGNGKNDGAFIVLKTCHETTPPDFADTGIPCLSSPGTMSWDPCPVGTSCSYRDDFLFLPPQQNSWVRIGSGKRPRA